MASMSVVSYGILEYVRNKTIPYHKLNSYASNCKENRMDIVVHIHSIIDYSALRGET